MVNVAQTIRSKPPSKLYIYFFDLNNLYLKNAITKISFKVQTQSSLRPVFEMPDYWLEEDWTPERIRQGWRKFQEK